MATETAAPPRRWRTIRNVSEETGLSREMLRRLAQKRRFTTRRLNRRTEADLDSVLRYLASTIREAEAPSPAA